VTVTMYRLPAVCEPELEDIRAINEELRFRCTQHELEQMTGGYDLVHLYTLSKSLV
jgi:hypothetical protein